MNKQLIERLAERAVEKVQTRPNGICDMGKYNLEFARLIVDECINLIDREVVSDNSEDLMVMIEHHFGISYKDERYSYVGMLRQRSEALVIALVGKEMAPKWWQSENKAFGDKTAEVMFQEDPEAVYNYLMDHANK